jgi:hypothetical protein
VKDFNSGDIHGDVTINDNSSNNEYKLLANCSNEELRYEEKHRRALLNKERSRKYNIFWKSLAFSAILLLVAACYFYILDEMNTVTLAIGAAGIMIGMASLKQSDIVTNFEQRQIATLNEIHTLLRERGVR